MQNADSGLLQLTGSLDYSESQDMRGYCQLNAESFGVLTHIAKIDITGVLRLFKNYQEFFRF